MANWSNLLPELVALIAKRLESRFDIVRFRSVCSPWRSSVPPRLYPVPSTTHLPSINLGSYTYSLKHITRNTFYLVRLSQGNRQKEASSSSCWVVGVRDGIKMGLLPPLSNDEYKPLPVDFPKVLDLTNFQVLELGHEYVGEYYNVPVERPPHCRREKVVFLRSSTDSDDDFVMAAFYNISFGDLALVRWGEKGRILFKNVNHGIDDIISYNGKFYVVHMQGGTMVIDQSLNFSLLGQIGSRSSRRRFLVKSVDNFLLLVDMCCSSSPSFKRAFRVWRLNEEEHKWVELKSLRDQILFLGSFQQAISAPASEFCWGRGNLIFYWEPDPSGEVVQLMYVFDLETGIASPLEDCPAYRNLFWPPQQWLTSPESSISSTQVTGNSTHSTPSAKKLKTSI